MAAEQLADLADVRRLEAVGFRAWPAAAVHYDGTWMVRLTANHHSGRLNSINPMDPADRHRLDERIERLSKYFRDHGRTPAFRLTPLSAPEIGQRLDELGWTTVKRTVVMRLPLREQLFADVVDRPPVDEVERFVAASSVAHGYDPAVGPALARVLDSIRAERGLFVAEEDGAPVASTLCVRDGNLAGIFEVATATPAQGKGHARRLVLAALKWAFARGARQAYLQVEEANTRAVSLYRSMGFDDAYRYLYRQPQEQARA